METAGTQARELARSNLLTGTAARRLQIMESPYKRLTFVNKCPMIALGKG
jgi:hypothetical protein